MGKRKRQTNSNEVRVYDKNGKLRRVISNPTFMGGNFTGKTYIQMVKETQHRILDGKKSGYYGNYQEVDYETEDSFEDVLKEARERAEND